MTISMRYSYYPARVSAGSPVENGQLNVLQMLEDDSMRLLAVHLGDERVVAHGHGCDDAGNCRREVSAAVRKDQWMVRDDRCCSCELTCC